MIILAHSWGTFLALEYAIIHQAKISQLILISPCPVTYEGQKRYSEINNTHLEHLKDVMKPFASFETFAQLSAQEINDLYATIFGAQCYRNKDVKKLTFQFDEISGQNGYKSMMVLAQNSWLQKDTNLLPAMQNITIPTLIIHGDSDAIPLDTVQDIHHTMANSQLVVVEQCGHYPFAETPKECFNAITSFLTH